MMSKEDRWVHWSSSAVARGASTPKAAELADLMEAEFVKRFPEQPPVPTLAEQAKQLANERGCIGCVVLTPQEVTEACIAHVAATLEPGQHIDFAMAQQSVVLGIGQSAQVVTEDDVVGDDVPDLSETPTANQGGELEGGTVLRFDRPPEGPGAVADPAAYEAAVESGTLTPLDGPDCA